MRKLHITAFLSALVYMNPMASHSEPSLKTEGELVEICVGGVGYTVPNSTHLRVAIPDEEREYISTQKSESAEKLIWSPGSEPIKANALIVWWLPFQKRAGLNIDTLFADAKYNVGKFRISTLAGSDISRFLEKHGEYRVWVSGNRQFAPEQLKLFGRRVLLSCGRSLPAFSSDPNRASCSIQARNDVGSFSFQFMVAADKPELKPWPAPDWEGREFSAWNAPLRELEAAITTMKTVREIKCK
ncbi:MAG: hypothetical protein ABJO43_13415 [Marinobacter sp.]|uniref:hypothetical protein n=1 Tax=Marinobacter sp. TaxID=50741 RepID=UPI003298111E